MPQNETNCEFLFVTVILTKMKLHYPGLKYLKGNICACDMQTIYKNKGIYSKYQNRNRFYFIHPQWKLTWTEFFTWRNVILVWVLCKHPLDIFRNISSYFFSKRKDRISSIAFLKFPGFVYYIVAVTEIYYQTWSFSANQRKCDFSPWKEKKICLEIKKSISENNAV